MHQPRRRREVSPRVLRPLAVLFRYSVVRDAYVLRGVGGRFGPVLRARRDGQAPVSAKPRAG